MIEMDSQGNCFIDDEASKRKDLIHNMLSNCYLLAPEKGNGINPDLLWILLSERVVIMPAERRISSWLVEGFLELFMHFVPVASDYSDIDENTRWCEDNLAEAKVISERANLFVHDMLLDM